MDPFHQTRRFDNHLLIPAIWRDQMGAGIPYVFNPSVIAHGDEMILAYRVVLADGQRHIALCRLDKDLAPITSSIVPFTHHLLYADEAADDTERQWAADPRLTWLGTRLYVNFNTGSVPSPNRIYLAEVDPDTLLPLGPAREVQRAGRRRKIEKNWMFFSHGETAYVIYQFAPLEILKADLSQPDRVLCEPAFLHQWAAGSYEQPYGGLRGSASPVLHQGRLYALAHSACLVEPRRPRSGGPPIRYVAAMVAMAAEPPFEPVAVSAEPLAMLNAAERALPLGVPLSPRVEDSLYACGAAAYRGDLLISYGISNQYAAVRRIGWDRVETNMLPAIRPLSRPAVCHDLSRREHEAFAPARASRSVPLSDHAVQTSGDSAFGDPALASEVRRGRSGAATLRAHWWRPHPALPYGAKDHTALNTQGQFVHGNFGDMTVPFLLQRLTGLDPRHCDDGARLLTVGSILQTARDGDVIWGTGLNGALADRFRTPACLHVHATRGPISLDFLRRHGVDVSRVATMFDPAALIPHLYADEIAVLRQRASAAMQDVLIIPHFKDDTVMRKLYPAYQDRIVAADTTLFSMIARILGASLVVSSSLHGLVLAEALGVPAVWHQPLMGEDELKYHDYYLGTGRYNIVRVATLHDAFTVAAMPLPEFDVDAILASFPSSDELAAYGLIDRRQVLRPGRLVNFSAPLPDGMEALRGWSAPEPHGRWNNGDMAELAIDVGEEIPDGLCCELLLSGYLPLEETVQRIAISDGTADPFIWTIERPGEKLLRFPLRAAAVEDGKIVLSFRFPNAVSPASLGKASDVRRLAVALKSFRIRSEELPMTDDPALHLATGDLTVPSEAAESGTCRFVLEELTGPVRLLSRVSHMIDRQMNETGPYRHDPRVLGVAVERIVIRRDGSVDDLAADDPRLADGWWPAETIGDRPLRWTDGAGVLPVLPGGPVTVELYGVRTVRYAAEEEIGPTG